MAQDPEQAAILAALAHHQAGRFAEAERGYLAVLARRPWHPAALHLAGVVAHQQGRHAEAVDRITSAIAVDPNRPEFHLNLGSALQSLGKVAAAEQCFAKAIQLDPRLPEGHFNRALSLQRMGRVEAAEASVRQAIALRPRYPQALSTLAALLSVRQRFDEAAAAAQGALAADPRHVPAYTAMADVCRRAGDLAGARVWCERALAIAPNAAEAHATLSVVLLLAGDFDNGWREYEWRWAGADQAVARQRFPGPIWDGSPLPGRAILLWVEQGLGDAIQFVRFAPRVRARAGRVVVECPPALVELLRTAPGVDEVVGTGSPRPACDAHCPLGSLPFVLRTGADTLTAPYLSVDPKRAAAWAERLGPRDDRLRVGLVWAGSPTHLNDRNRSMTLRDLAPLLDVPGVLFVSLQKDRAPSPGTPGEGRGEGDFELRTVVDVRNHPHPNPLPAYREREPDRQLLDVSAALTDLAETAAALANLDLLVSVDSSVNHLAGAIGTPAWLLLPFAPDWRWRLGDRGTAWYPSVRLFRQARPGAWAGPVAEAARELAAVVARRPPGGSRAPSQHG